MSRNPYRTSAMEQYERHADAGTFSVPSGSVPKFAETSGFGGGLVRAFADGGLGLANAGAKLYADYQNGRVEDVAMGHEMAFEVWKKDYMDKHKGVDAATAFQDFGKAWGDMAEQTLRDSKFGENENAYRLLRHRLMAGGLTALKQAETYSLREVDNWRNSQWQSQEAMAMDQIAANASDDQLCEFTLGNLAQLYNQRNPGMDNRAAIEGLRQKANEARFNALMGAGDLDGAAAMLERMAGSQGQFGQGFGQESGNYAGMGAGKANPGSVEIPGGRLTREEVYRKSAGYINAKLNNPGNVKVDNNNFAVYASYEDGIKAIFGRFRRYHNAPKRGWHAQTIRQIFTIYAPPNENNTNSYVKAVAKATGIDADAPIDFDNAEVMSKIAAATLTEENSINVDYRTLVPIFEDFRRTGAPKAIGSTPAKKAARIASFNAGGMRYEGGGTAPLTGRASATLGVGMGAGGQSRVRQLRSGGDMASPQMQRFAGMAMNAGLAAMRDKLDIAYNARNLRAKQEENQRILSSLATLKPDEIEAYISRQPLELQAGLRAEAKRISEAREKQFTEDYNESVNGMIMEGLRAGRTDAQVLAQALAMAQGLSGSRRDKAEKYARERVKEVSDMLLTARTARFDDFLAANANIKDSEALYALAREQFKDDAKMLDYCGEYFRGGMNKETTANNAALMRIYQLKDSGDPSVQTLEQRNRYYYEHKMTPAQRQAAEEYQGRAGVVTYTSVAQAFGVLDPDSYRGQDKDYISREQFEGVIALLPPGKKSYSQNEILRAAALYRQSGVSKKNPWFWRDERQSPGDFAAEHEGKINGWTPEPDDDQIRRLAPGLKRLGLDPDNLAERDLNNVIRTLIADQSGGAYGYDIDLTDAERRQISEELHKIGVEASEANIQKTARLNILRAFPGFSYY